MLDENGIRRPVYVYCANLAMDGKVFTKAAGGAVISLPAAALWKPLYDHAWTIRIKKRK